MSNLDELSVIRNHINALRILFTAALILMFICIARGDNSVGLLFAGCSVVVLCLLSNKHSDRIYTEQLHNCEGV